MKQLLENGDISQEAFDKFFDGARVFFSKVYRHYVKWLPLEHSLLQNCKFVNFELRSTSFVWLRSTYSWIFWYHKSAINRTSQVIRHVGRRIYGSPSHGKNWCTTAHLGWIFRYGYFSVQPLAYGHGLGLSSIESSITKWDRIRRLSSSS